MLEEWQKTENKEFQDLITELNESSQESSAAEIESKYDQFDGLKSRSDWDKKLKDFVDLVSKNQ